MVDTCILKYRITGYFISMKYKTYIYSFGMLHYISPWNEKTLINAFKKTWFNGVTAYEKNEVNIFIHVM